ncbi:MAG TPA: hypothetical protein VNK95_16035 [Caldilineaceae bacterium]|nr:hypothetical protein [Caldilineaceae bacterium]
MTSTAGPPPLDPYMAVIAERAQTGLAPFPAVVAAAGRRLLARLAPPQWRLEWYLPKWLGDAYGLSPETTATLVLANVYGLAYVALQDRIADEEVAPDEQATTVCLGAAFHHLWLRQYVALCPAESRFWDCFDDYMQQWLAATAASNTPPAGDFAALLREHPARLSDRAAPLKVCCAAGALLAGRGERLPPLLQTLDHLHLAAVLVDHVHDWRGDLVAGRYNAFVHYASQTPQTRENEALNRQRVHELLLLGDGGKGYFRTALDQLQLARRWAQQAHCPPLKDYLAWYEAMVIRCRDSLTASAHALLQAAGAQLFGSAEPAFEQSTAMQERP